MTHPLPERLAENLRGSQALGYCGNMSSINRKRKASTSPLEVQPSTEGQKGAKRRAPFGKCVNILCPAVLSEAAPADHRSIAMNVTIHILVKELTGPFALENEFPAFIPVEILTVMVLPLFCIE